jgi:hypothetical protein
MKKTEGRKSRDTVPLKMGRVGVEMFVLLRELEDELAVYQKIPGQFKPTVQEW